MLQTPQLSSTPVSDLSQGPGSALVFWSAISLCQWSYWKPRIHESVFWHQEPLCSSRRMVSFHGLAELHRCCWEGELQQGAGTQWPGGLQLCHRLPFGQHQRNCGCKRIFPAFPQGCKKQSVAHDKMFWWMCLTGRNSLQRIFISSLGWKSKWVRDTEGKLRQDRRLS